jgi:hypothetical protein
LALPPQATSSGEEKRSVALMDGGVYDNQGIFSVLRVLGLTYDTKDSSDAYTPSDNSLKGILGAGSVGDKKADKDIDLFIVSDTPLREEPIYKIGAHPEGAGFLDLSKLKWMAGVAAFLLLGSILFLGYRYIDTMLEKGHFGQVLNIIVDIFAHVVPLVLLLACVGGYFFLTFKLKNYLDNSAAFINNKGLKEKLWNLIKRRKFADLGYMIQSRLGSAFAMSSDVFMNRIRFLGYARLLNIPALKNKTIINVIDSVVREKGKSGGDGGQNIDKRKIIPKRLKEIVAKASKTPTQFWLAEEDWRDLIACGQATMCYNLLRHMNQMGIDNSAVAQNDHFKELYQKASNDWEKLKADPYCLLKKSPNRV